MLDSFLKLIDVNVFIYTLIGIFCFGILVFVLNKKRKKLEPTPRPNRLPYNRRTYRK